MEDKQLYLSNYSYEEVIHLYAPIMSFRFWGSCEELKEEKGHTRKETGQ